MVSVTLTQNLDYFAGGRSHVWPPQRMADQIMRPDFFLIGTVKRVVGITQPGSPTQDGSEMLVTFSRGELYPHDARNSPVAWTAPRTDQRRHLTPPDDNFGGTGYDAPERGVLAFDALLRNPLRTSPRSIYRVSFPEIDNPPGPEAARLNTSGSQTATQNNVSRYTQETVNLSLRLPTQAPGVRPLRFRSP